MQPSLRPLLQIRPSLEAVAVTAAVVVIVASDATAGDAVAIAAGDAAAVAVAATAAVDSAVTNAIAVALDASAA